jgi:hypothetical protein
MRRSSGRRATDWALAALAKRARLVIRLAGIKRRQIHRQRLHLLQPQQR